jgi:hypothetical protein
MLSKVKAKKKSKVVIKIRFSVIFILFFKSSIIALL